MFRSEGEWAVVENFLLEENVFGSLLIARYNSKSDAQAAAMRNHREVCLYELDQKILDQNYLTDYPEFEVLTFREWSELEPVPLSAGMRPDLLRKYSKG